MIFETGVNIGLHISICNGELPILSLQISTGFSLVARSIILHVILV